MLRDAWYAAAWSSELGRSPLGRRLLGERVVLFRDEQGKAHALSAVCPHRGGDLAEGRVVEGQIQCPYHGFRFDGTGRCRVIPSQPSSQRIPENAKTRRYALREQQGVLWIHVGDENPSTAPPRYDFWDHDSGARRIDYAGELWRSPFVYVVEQALDAAHVPYVHQVSTSAEGEQVARQRIDVDADLRGFTSQDDPETPWQGQLGPGGPAPLFMLRERVLGLGRPVGRHVRFDLGGAVHVFIDYGRHGWDVILVLATPADGTSTWVFGCSIRTRARHLLGDLLQRRYLDRVMREDKVCAEVLCYGESPEGFSRAASVPSDQPSLTFRKLYDHWLAAGA